MVISVYLASVKRDLRILLVCPEKLGKIPTNIFTARFILICPTFKNMFPLRQIIFCFICLCRMTRWCCRALHPFLKNRSSCAFPVRDLGIVCVSSRPPQMLRQLRDSVGKVYLKLFPRFYWLSCVSECPSGSCYLLLHFGAVPICACIAGDAVQHLCG